jgi:acyl-CoA thioester hydrolase
MHRAAYIAHAEEAVSRFWKRWPTVSNDPAFRIIKVACTIHHPLHLNDDIATTVRVSKIGGRSAGCSVLFNSGETLAAEAEIIWCAVEPDSGDALPLSEELRDWLYQYLD